MTHKRVYDPDAGKYLDVLVVWNGRDALTDGSGWRTTSSRLLDYAPGPDWFMTQREARLKTYDVDSPVRLTKPRPKRVTCKQCFNRKAKKDMPYCGRCLGKAA